MEALTVAPDRKNSLRLDTLPDPVPGEGELLVDGLAVGVCGTDREILSGDHGAPPPGRERLVVGHESLGRVRQAPPDSGWVPGDLVVGVVRRPDPVPCGACAHGRFDMCRNGRFTERGIKELDGYAATSWTVEADYAVRLDPGLEHVGVLLEPATVVAKAWEQVELIGARSWFAPHSVLVTGAGPIGLLAALLGRQRGLEVHVLDRVESGPKPELVRRLGAEYHSDDVERVMERVRPDVVIEATGAASVVFGVMSTMGPYGMLCLTGLSPSGRTLEVDAGYINRELVLDNSVVVGTVNATLRHYAAAAEALAEADRGWLDSVITRRVPLESFAEAFEPEPDDIKTIIELARH
ncbi:alcohol dehydrogenase catalytic domain-containing protein [Streptomyces sp. TRM43335]|uniref:2-deoxy-scyllo-inosamine dehydrogenase n=1 Tax=Streptomyces taklimakanensis TaxID=2569853 RepID=A0A6G2B715_9ACTN|nr:alcohol dehydrogenase catalytic domain-containing protein [Streptomyces taklimakanensis]